MALGSFCLVRQRKPVNRWARAGVPEFFPNWIVMLRLPGLPRRGESARAPICDLCLAVEGSPTVARPDCRCQRPAREFATELLKTSQHLWRQNRLQALRELRGGRRAAPALRRVQEVYMANLPERMKQSGRENWNALLSIVEQVTGLSPEAVLELPISCLSKQLALDWMRLRQAYNADLSKPEGERRSWGQLRAALKAGELPGLVIDVPLPGNYTINTMLGKAKSIAGKKSRSFYLNALELPDLSGFCSVSRLIARHGHEALERGVIAKIEEQAAGWRKTNVDLWIAHQLMSRMGLRPREVLAARRSWLEYEKEPRFRPAEAGAGWILVVRNRPEENFWQKARGKAITRRYVVDRDLAAVLLRRRRKPWLFAPDLAPTGRRNLIERTLSKELRRFLASRKGTNYELRKHYISTIYSKHGREAAAAQGGHATSETTEGYYATRLGVLPTVTGAELAG